MTKPEVKYMDIDDLPDNALHGYSIEVDCKAHSVGYLHAWREWHYGRKRTFKKWLKWHYWQLRDWVASHE